MSNLESNKDSNVLANEINVIKEQTNRIVLQSSCEIGKRLKEAKELVGHGNWTDWLKEKVNYSHRTANNLIKIYEEYDAKILENSNSQLLANLGYTQAISMLKLDFEERENFVKENDVDEMTVKELEEAIKEKLELKKEKERLEKLLNEAIKSDTKNTELIEEKLEVIANFEKQMEEKNKEIRELNEIMKLSVEEEAEDPEELEKLQEEVKKRKDEIRDLKKQLKEKPKAIEVEVEKIIEVIPEDIEKELEALKARVMDSNNKLNAAESISKFKSTFNMLVKLFNDLVMTLDDIEKEVPEEYGKYKTAVNKFLEQLKLE